MIWRFRMLRKDLETHPWTRTWCGSSLGGRISSFTLFYTLSLGKLLHYASKYLRIFDGKKLRIPLPSGKPSPARVAPTARQGCCCSGNPPLLLPGPTCSHSAGSGEMRAFGLGWREVGRVLTWPLSGAMATLCLSFLPWLKWEGLSTAPSWGDLKPESLAWPPWYRCSQQAVCASHCFSHTCPQDFGRCRRKTGLGKPFFSIPICSKFWFSCA